MHRVRCPNCESLLPGDASGCAGCGSDLSGEPIVTDQALMLWMGPSGRPHDGTWLRDLT